MMKPGERIHVRACKTDGTIYRSWYAAIESVEPGSIVTIAPAESPVEDLVRGMYFTEHPMRAYYWFDKFYNLIEVFETNGDLLEIYINVASPPEFVDGEMRFIDHELDVVKVIPEQARLVDEDEFTEAIIKYRYGEEFQGKLRAAARQALELADHWQAKSLPDFGGINA